MKSENRKLLERFNKKYRKRTRTLAGMIDYLKRIGLKRREIAAYMGKKPAAVDQIVNRAREKQKETRRAAVMENRRPDCRHYSKCLSAAAKKNADKVGCADCRAYASDAALMADSVLIVADYSDDDARIPAPDQALSVFDMKLWGV